MLTKTQHNSTQLIKSQRHLEVEERVEEVLARERVDVEVEREGEVVDGAWKKNGAEGVVDEAMAQVAWVEFEGTFVD